jgi:hypothetical protein
VYCLACSRRTSSMADSVFDQVSTLTLVAPRPLRMKVPKDRVAVAPAVTPRNRRRLIPRPSRPDARFVCRMVSPLYSLSAAQTVRPCLPVCLSVLGRSVCLIVSGASLGRRRRASRPSGLRTSLKTGREYVQGTIEMVRPTRRPTPTEHMSCSDGVGWVLQVPRAA